MKKEIWKDIPGYENLYQASNLGRIKSLARTIMRSNGIIQSLEERILKPWIIRNGYYTVLLYKNNKGKGYLVHRLVLFAFIGKSNLEGNHINCNPSDNRLENLEWVTHLENSQHAWRNGRYERAINDRKKKINQYDLKGIFIKIFDSITEASKETKINLGNISSCCSGKRKIAGNFKWEINV